uniref:HMA domain-containing protein n=1 Tax=Fagus sylvatica TaxID=28930 RepID=A0A2N9FIV2_FAGSY
MKQKIVIKVQMTSDKCRTKAMKIAATTDGVNSVALEGSSKDQLVVIGEDVDSAKLTCVLGKKLCYASILTVEEVKPVEPKEDKNTVKDESTCPPCPRFCEVVVYDRSPSYCFLM